MRYDAKGPAACLCAATLMHTLTDILLSSTVATQPSSTLTDILLSSTVATQPSSTLTDILLSSTVATQPSSTLTDGLHLQLSLLNLLVLSQMVFIFNCRYSTFYFRLNKWSLMTYGECFLINFFFFYESGHSQ